MANAVTVKTYQDKVLAEPSVTHLWRMSEAASPFTSFGGGTMEAVGDGIVCGQDGLLSGDSNGAVANVDTTGNSYIAATALTGVDAGLFTIEFLIRILSGTYLNVFALYGTGNDFAGVYNNGIFTVTHTPSGHTLSCAMEPGPIYQIDLSYDGVVIRLYCNGVLAQSVTSVGIFSALTNLTFGGGAVASCVWILDEVSTYAVALTNEQIKSNYALAAYPPLAMMNVNPFPREGCPVRGVRVDGLDDTGNVAVSTGYRLGTKQLLSIAGIGKGSYLNTVLSYAPAAFYRLGDAAGSEIAIDSSGFGNNGPCVGGIGFGYTGAIASDNNKAAALDGTGRVTTDFAVTTYCSFSVWLYPTSYGSTQSAIADLGGPNFFLDSSGHLACFASSANHVSTYLVPLNTWTLVGLTSDGATVTLFANGIPVLVVSGVLFQLLDNLYIGGRGDHPGDPDWSFHGLMDEAAYFAATLPAAAILDIYNSAFGDQPPAGFRAAARDANGLWTEWNTLSPATMDPYVRGGTQAAIGSGETADLSLSSPGIVFPDLAQGSGRMSVRMTIVGNGFLDEVRSVRWPKGRAAFSVKLDNLDSNARMLLHRFFRGLNGPQRPFFFDYVEPSDGMRTTGVARRYLVRFRDSKLTDSLFGGSFTEAQFILVEVSDCPSGGDTYSQQFAPSRYLDEATNPPNWIDTEFQFEPRIGLEQSPKWKLADTSVGIWVGNGPTYEEAVIASAPATFYQMGD